MANLKQYNGRYCESEYEYAFIGFLEAEGWNYSSGNNQLTNWVLLGISVLVLAGGLVFAILYGRKRY